MIDFIKQYRKILASFFFSVAILSAIIDGLILLQRPQIFHSRADSTAKVNSSIEINKSASPEFISPKAFYTLSFDKKMWTFSKQPDENFGERIVFDLNKENGFARLAIIEGENQENLLALTNEVIKKLPSTPTSIQSVKFKERPSYLLTLTEKILGQEIFYYLQITKDNDNFYIFEKSFADLGYSGAYLDNLLENFAFSNSKELPQTKGVFSEGLPLTTVELVDLVRPSVMNIFHYYCMKIVNLNPSLSFLSQSEYNFCGISKGSGSIINEKGIVATNGHVVKIYPERGLLTNMLYEGNKNFTMDLIKAVYLSSGQILPGGNVEYVYKNVSLNPHYMDRFLAEIFKLIDKKAVSLSVNEEKYYVNAGNEPIRVVQGRIIPSATTYTAELLGFDYPNSYSYDAIVKKKYTPGSDVALLQIKDSSNPLFPALDLGNIETLKEGSDVVVAGYPVLVEGGEGPNAAISYNTSTKPTITRGIVSAIKQDSSGRKVIQTDASIDHGNSGGPAFNSSGQVIGVATFVVESQSGNFNFIREAADLKNLMVKHQITNEQGNVSKKWKEGLDSFRNKKYGEALNNFKQVEKLSPAHPTVRDFIQISEKAIKNGESLEGIASFIKGQNSNVTLFVFGGISTISFMIAGFLTVVPLFERKPYS